MVEALRCEMSSMIENAFRTGSGATARSDELVGRHLPGTMRASAWRAVRGKVVERDGRRCRICGKDLASVPAWLTEVHHIVPRCEGGGDHPSNLVTLCVMCHKRATVAPQDERRLRGEEWLPRDALSAFE
jgi:5-methylcytosine-specific restriction endonuclease McrA